jgi:hypothetical protein
MGKRPFLMSLLFQNAAVIIRAAGERTRDLCAQLARNQVGPDAVEVVSDQPFERSLRLSYETGIGRGGKWTMTLDADVLLREGAVAQLLAEAEALPPDFAQIEGLVFDKITGTFREAGHRVYRTALLPLALNQIPAPGTEIRPEFTTVMKLDALGYPSRRVAVVMGVHDHEQYFRDLYRKAFVHAHKHDYLLAHFVRRCRALMSADADFRVLLRGLWDGLQHPGPVRADIAAFPLDLEPILVELALNEKSPLPASSFTSAMVQEWLTAAGPAPHFREWCRPGKRPPDASLGLGRRWHRLLRAHGFFGATLQILGEGLCRVGGRLRRVSTAGLAAGRRQVKDPTGR